MLLASCRSPPMKVFAGGAQPVNSVLRRWIGGAFFISPTSSHAKQTLLRPPNDESSVPVTHTRRSVATTRSVGALPPSPPLLLLGNTRSRSLSGTGRGLSPEERSAVARARLQPRRGDVNVNVDVAPVDNVPIDLDDLQDLNAEIAGYVGSLGDPDFDLQENTPTFSATDRRHDHGHRHRTDHRDAREEGYSDGPQQQHQQQQQQTTDSDRIDHTDPVETRGNLTPASPLLPRRLTLADHPTSPASAGTRQTNTEDISVEAQVENHHSSIWVEELRAHSAASSKQPPHTGPREGTPSVLCLGAATGNHHADSSKVASRGHGSSLERRGRLRGRTSVLVLNGAACFVGGRLASTGEPQGYVTKVMEEAAADFNILLTVCTSNREHELLDHLCAGKYDAVIYNPAGFGPWVVNSATSEIDRGLPSDPAHPMVDIRKQSVPESMWGRGRALDDRKALEYGLIRAGCPVLTLAPRDTHLETSVSRGFGSIEGGALEGGVSGRPLDHAGGYIAGFSGAVSYRLAIAAVADMLESEGEL